MTLWRTLMWFRPSNRGRRRLSVIQNRRHRPDLCQAGLGAHEQFRVAALLGGFDYQPDHAEEFQELIDAETGAV